MSGQVFQVTLTVEPAVTAISVEAAVADLWHAMSLVPKEFGSTYVGRIEPISIHFLQHKGVIRVSVTTTCGIHVGGKSGPTL